MCPEVRVHVRLASIRLEYEGDQTFYEEHVEGLLEAAGAGRRVPPPLETRRATAAAPVPATTAPVPTAAPAPRVERALWKPESAEFGRYIRRLGPEAAEADRQVVAFAFYLWNYERREIFGRTELEGCFQALHLPVPTPLDPILEDVTERKRFLERAGETQWRLTKKGENYVKTRLLTS